jgi:hypothetical protein
MQARRTGRRNRSWMILRVKSSGDTPRFDCEESGGLQRRLGIGFSPQCAMHGVLKTIRHYGSSTKVRGCAGAAIELLDYGVTLTSCSF